MHSHPLASWKPPGISSSVELLQLLNLDCRAKHCIIPQLCDVPPSCLPVGLDNLRGGTGLPSPTSQVPRAHKSWQLVQMAVHPGGQRIATTEHSVLLGKHPATTGGILSRLPPQPRGPAPFSVAGRKWLKRTSCSGWSPWG